MTGKSSGTVLVWGTDPHLSDKAPASRTDDWATIVIGKFDQIGELCREYDADAALFGGDIFNLKSPDLNSHRLVIRLTKSIRKYPCPVYSCVGNHDLKWSDMKFLYEAPLEELFASGVFERLYDEHEGIIGSPKVKLTGIPYHGKSYDLERFKSPKKEDSDYLVCVVHCLASKSGGSMFEREDVIKYSDLLELNPDVDVWCFLPGTKVLDWNGRQLPIEEVRGSLALMGRHGEPVAVEKIHPVRQVDEDIIKFDVEGVPEVLMPGVTMEHPFWVARDLKCHLPSRCDRRCHPDKSRNSHPCSTCSKAPSVQAGWLHASEIRKGDYLAVPVPSSSSVAGISNPQRARLLGLYLAEGHIILNRTKDPVAGVAWSLHEDETELERQVMNAVASQFGLETKSHPTTGACTQVCAYGSDIAEWFQEQGGRYSHSKCFSSSVWSWPAADKMELLLGWLLGDGHARDPEKPDRIRTEVMAGTASPQLASQMYLLALSLGLRPSYSVWPPKEGVEVNGRVCNVREFHVISFYGDDGERLAHLMGISFQPRTKTKVAGFFQDGMYFARVRSVIRDHYRGPVYNIRTSNEEYIAGMLVTHNCFGHWHENQGVTEIAPGKWVVNVGSMTRGSLSQDNLERIPECAVMRFSPEGIEIIQKPLKVEPPEKVFDLERRAAVESREKVMNTFVDRLEQTLSQKGEADFEGLIKGVENIPTVVSDRALEFIAQAKSKLDIT